MNSKPYSLGRLFLYYTPDRYILVAKISSVALGGFGLEYWYHDLKRWGSLFEALSCAIPLTESLEDELEDLQLASNPGFIKAMRKLDSSPGGLRCPCGFLDCELYNGRDYPGRVIHCPFSHLWANNPISPHMRGVKSDCPTASEFELKETKKIKEKDKKTWSGMGTLYETETDSGFVPCVVLSDDFPLKCESQKVKVRLELVEDSK